MARAKRELRRRWLVEVVSLLAVLPLIYVYVEIVKAIDPAWLKGDLTRIVLVALTIMVGRFFRDGLLERKPIPSRPESDR